MQAKLQHVISARQFSDPKLLAYLFAEADEMERNDRSRTLPDLLHGRILATLFYEPSTRTRFSFEAAMQKLGGGVLTAENMRERRSRTPFASSAAMRMRLRFDTTSREQPQRRRGCLLCR
jgi:aspartate carbamoyltransferase catalytic subunit